MRLRSHKHVRTAFAGAIAGAAGALVMELMELITAPAMNRVIKHQRKAPSGIGHQTAFDPLFPGEGPTAEVAETFFALAGAHPSRLIKRAAAICVHVSFGAALGVAYSSMQELSIPVEVGKGLPFGFVAWIGAAQLALPAAGLSKTPARSPLLIQIFGLCAHLAFGATVRLTYPAALSTIRHAKRAA